METFICSKCHRQGCFTQSEDDPTDWICKCGHSVQVEPEPIVSLGPTVYEAAVELLKGGCAVAALPRRLGIGQIVADAVFARLEREGVVGKAKADGTREVLKP